ncbi:hypothetical protein C0J52_03985 [Blattella germanica]|nr:hypothetical protein C0J52_03985 [Blattella germanica]
MFTSNQLLELMAQIMGVFQEILIRLHHGKQHFSIGKDVILVFAVLKTGRGVERRRHEKKHVLEALLRWNNLLSSRHVNVLRNSVYRG